MFPSNMPPTSPGKILLKEFLVPLRLAQTALAKRYSKIISGKRKITSSIAQDLAKFSRLPLNSGLVIKI